MSRYYDDDDRGYGGERWRRGGERVSYGRDDYGVDDYNRAGRSSRGGLGRDYGREDYGRYSERDYYEGDERRHGGYYGEGRGAPPD